MKKGSRIEFNDNRMSNIRKEGTFSIIYMELPNEKFRIHTEVIIDGEERHLYINVDINDITKID